MVELNNGGSGGSSLTVTDNVTTIGSVVEIVFTGAVVSSGGAGIADVTIGGFTLLTATGAVNGSNQAFTFIQQPNLIVSDGVMYKKLDNNGATQWTWNAGTLTATMTIPPSSAIFGIA